MKKDDGHSDTNVKKKKKLDFLALSYKTQQIRKSITDLDTHYGILDRCKKKWYHSLGGSFKRACNSGSHGVVAVPLADTVT